MQLILLSDLASVLVLALTIIACAVSLRRLRQLVCCLGFQIVARFLIKDRFLGLHAFPETVRSVQQHRMLENSCELTVPTTIFSQYRTAAL